MSIPLFLTNRKKCRYHPHSIDTSTMNKLLKYLKDYLLKVKSKVHLSFLVFLLENGIYKQVTPNATT